MGLSSNARLLTITSRLTSNEYESQQISNAKLRLATQSQEASADYLDALNQQSYSFVTYDMTGTSVYNDFSANILYQYADNKNQYILSNVNGVPLVSKTDAQNFKESATLNSFLQKYNIGITYADGSSDSKKEEKTLAYYASEIDNYYNKDGTTEWESFLKDMSEEADNENNEITYYLAWQNGQNRAFTDYSNAHSEYEKAIIACETDGSVTRSQISILKNKLNTKYEEYIKYSSFSSYIEIKCADRKEVKKYQEYKKNLANYENLLEQLKVEPDEAYTYEDVTKAQWYTNLWYKMNGASTVKSDSASYQVLSSELASSASWITDSLNQGIISIEQATYTSSKNTVPDPKNPVEMKLNGINLNSKILSSCSDIVQKDDDEKLSKAQAQYQKRTAEINAKDEKFQRKLTKLNTEHSALQTEYDSVKSALDKNIDRSFKTFNG